MASESERPTNSKVNVLNSYPAAEQTTNLNILEELSLKHSQNYAGNQRK
jgi:hypothetical protein